MQRHFVTVGDRHVHYRRAGAGPTIVLLHASPLSSSAVAELGDCLAEQRTVVALDVPGYGSSSPLPVAEPTIGDYAEAIAAALEALGINRTAVYGEWSGASIALELARRYPECVTTALLLSPPCLDEDTREEALEEWCPSLEPRWDGAHLVTAWAHVRDERTFRPRYRRRLDARIDGDLPTVAELNDAVLDLLRAGDGFTASYRAAFTYDALAALVETRVPVTLLSRPGDWLAPQMECVGAAAGVGVFALPRAATAAATTLLRMLERVKPAPQAPPPQAVRPQAYGLTLDYATTPYGQLRVRRGGGGQARPVVLLHGSPGSAAPLEPLANALAATRPVFALDTLGHGESDKPPFDTAEIEDYAPIVEAALDDLGLDAVDLYGTHTGALIAIETAIRAPERVGSVILDGVTLLDDAEREEILANYFVSLEPRFDGTHLLAAWWFARDAGLWWPWYNRTRAGFNSWPLFEDNCLLHEYVLEHLKSGATYEIAYRAAFRYPTETRLPLLPVRALMCTHPNDPLHAYTEAAAALAPDAVAAVLPDEPAGAASLFAGFLDAVPAVSCPHPRRIS